MSHFKFERRTFIRAMSAAGLLSVYGCGGGGAGAATTTAGGGVAGGGGGSGSVGSSGSSSGSSSSSSSSSSGSGNSSSGGGATSNAFATLNPLNAVRFTSDKAGTIPVMAATVLKKGAYPSNVTPVANVANVHVIVKRRWNDGSAKHVIIAGLMQFDSANSFKDVALTTGSASSGNLSASSISAVAPTATVTLSGVGSVSLAGALSSPVRTWVATPNMVECHYLQKIGSDIYVWFQVRYFTGGHLWARVIVEYSKLPYTGNTQLAYVPSVTVGGTVLWNNGGANYVHALETRWSVEGWISGGADVTVRHDPLALRETKLIPNYFSDSPSETALNALKTSYMPGQLAGLREGYPDTGFHDQIGLLPGWDVNYLTTGDPRAWRSVQANSLALGTHATIWRSPVTNRPLLPSERPTQTYLDNGNGFNDITARSQTGTTLKWDIAHHASSGYTAYLITGDYIHLETMQMQCSTIYLGSAAEGGSGVNRIVYGQIRGTGWFFRTAGQLAALAPDNDPVAAEMASWLHNNAAFNKGKGPDLFPNSGLGYSMVWGPYQETGVLRIAPWMQNFWIQAVGHVSDLEPLADMSGFNTLRNWMYRAIVGLLGDGTAGTYDYRYAGLYNISPSPLSTTARLYPIDLHQTWGGVWSETQAYIHSIAESTGSQPADALFKHPANASANTLYPSSSSGDWGYFQNLLPAIAQAVDHGAPGAAQAWLRLVGAKNWNTVRAATLGRPMWAVAPRNALGALLLPQTLSLSSMPNWRQAMAPNTWAAIPGTNTVAQLDPASNGLLNLKGLTDAIWRGTGGQPQVMAAWSGAVLDAETDTLVVWGGGHNDYGGNEPYKIRLDQTTPSWSMVHAPTGSGSLLNATAALLESTVTPASSGTYFDGKPRSQHSYDKITWLPGHGMVLGRNSGGFSTGQLGDNKSWLLNVTTGAWSEFTAAGPSVLDYSTTFDPNRGRLWRFAPGDSSVRWCDANAITKTWNSLSTTGWTNLTGEPWYCTSEYIPGHDLIAVLSGRYSSPTISSLRLYDPAANKWFTPNLTGIDLTGIIKNWGYAKASWVPSLSALCLWDNEPGHEGKIVVLRPQGNLRTGTWEKSVITPSGSTTPGARQENGTYGRFRYSPRLNGFYLVNAVDQPVYFFALP